MTTYLIPEAARFLGVSTHTVRNYISNGMIKNAYKESGGWRGSPAWIIPESDLYDVINQKSKPKKIEKKEKHIRGSKKMETKRIMAALDEMDAAIMLLHETIGKLRTELG